MAARWFALTHPANLPSSRFRLPLRNVLENLKSSDFYCPGSILALDVDSSQPLARGIGRETERLFRQQLGI